jgi:hypothetical protein
LFIFIVLSFPFSHVFPFLFLLLFSLTS